MGEDNEREPLKLPISAATSSLSFMDSPEHPSGTATPPLQPPASVPFKWEETPGKPRPYPDIVTRPKPAPKSPLELPPMMMSRSKTPSPTTVLDGPYNVGRPKFSSFRFFLDGHDSSYHSPFSPPYNDDDDALEYGLFGANKKKKSSKGFFGKVKNAKKEFNGGISGFSPFSNTSCESDNQSLNNSSERRKMRRNGSFSNVPQQKSSPLWATIYSGLKQVVQWKSSRKSNKVKNEG